MGKMGQILLLSVPGQCYAIFFGELFFSKELEQLIKLIKEANGTNRRL